MAEVEGQDKIGITAAKAMEHVESIMEEEDNDIKITHAMIVYRVERKSEDPEANFPVESFHYYLSHGMYTSEVVSLIEMTKVELLRDDDDIEEE